MVMVMNWREAKLELEKRTQDVFEDCPDEIKRFHYGIISHSDAGKHTMNQYFGHWVHAYGYFMLYAGDILDTVRRLTADPDFSLLQATKLFTDLSMPQGNQMLLVEYGGQKRLGDGIDLVIGALDTLESKDEFLELLTALQSYASRLYWWFHWYFPWGLGTSCQRLTPEDIKEIARLSQTD
jgi:hypothetical protein